MKTRKRINRKSIIVHVYCHCLGDCGSFKLLSVCPAFTAYILFTIGQILMKLCGRVGTKVCLIVLKFHKNRLSDDSMLSFLIFFFFFCSFAKGENSMAKGNLTTTAYPPRFERTAQLLTQHVASPMSA